MRIIILGLSCLIIALTVQNLYLQEGLKETIRGQSYDYKIMEKFSEELYILRQNDTQE
jgi:hypothetical protein